MTATDSRHPATDYVSPGHLFSSACSVRFDRISKGVYRVELSIFDQDEIHLDEVAQALENAGMIRATVARDGFISVVAPSGFRAPQGFVRIDAL